MRGRDGQSPGCSELGLSPWITAGSVEGTGPEPSCSSKPGPGLDQEPSFRLLCRTDCKLSLNGDLREMSAS